VSRPPPSKADPTGEASGRSGSVIALNLNAVEN
jgi:hypothetical protein